MTDELERLERDLERLGRAVVWPPIPPLAAAVRQRLEKDARGTPPRPGWAWPSGRRAAAGLAAVAAVVLALVFGAWSPGREAVADLFDRLRIFETAESPEGLPWEIVGTPVAETEAEAALGFALKRPAYPAGLELRRTLLQDFEGVKAAVLFYEQPSGPSFALFETTATVAKGLPFGAEAEPVSGLGSEAYWLEGLRIVQYLDERDDLVQESRRATDANTLLWDEGGRVFRLEGDLPQEEAVRIALSLR
jgi:hypothetical protein